VNHCSFLSVVFSLCTKIFDSLLNSVLLTNKEYYKMYLQIQSYHITCRSAKPVLMTFKFQMRCCILRTMSQDIPVRGLRESVRILKADSITGILETMKSGIWYKHNSAVFYSDVSHRLMLTCTCLLIQEGQQEVKGEDIRSVSFTAERN